MSKKYSFLFSMPLTGILLVIMIVAMALATFIESAQGTNDAWALVYDTWWFEALFVLVLVNLSGSIVKYKLYRKSKWSVLLFHVAFILIIIGAGVTRYISAEGMMRIREGGMSASMVSNDTYLDVEVSDGEGFLSESKKVRLSASTPKRFSWKGKVNGKRVKIKSLEYMTNALARYVAAPGGEAHVQLVLLADRQYAVGLSLGERVEYPNISLAFDGEADLNLLTSDTGLIAIALHPVSITSMGGSGVFSYEVGSPIPLEQGKLYTMNGVRFALQEYMPSAILQYMSGDAMQHGPGANVARLEVEVEGMTGDLYLKGQKNIVGEPAELMLGSTRVKCTYGSHKIGIPFVLRLNDFVIERYPGSHSPSSFESVVDLIDVEMGINETRRIFMNNVLKHRGYRFYQSSYDQDEKGTVLSVNRDMVGTTITYIGYFLMTLGMLLALFMRGTRFSAMASSTSKAGSKKSVVLLAFILASSGLFAQQMPVPTQEQAEEFGELWVQDKGGRFKPMNTLSYEVMNKVSKKSVYKGLDADQVMLGMIVFPEAWKAAPLFEVENAELHQLIGYKGQYVCFNDFLKNGRYILSGLVDEAYKKRVQDRTDLDKEVMKLDEKVNVFYMVQTGGLLKIFPDRNDSNGKWLAVSDLMEADHTAKDTLAQVFLLYANAIGEGDGELAGQLISSMQVYQVNNSDFDLSEGKKKAEIMYNKFGMFNKLARFYGLFGLLLLVMQFLRIFRPRKWVEWMFIVGIIHLTVAFILHTFGLGIRWYISGHAPLSNGYESMIFVSWISLLAGLIFARRTGFAIALTGILSALSLLVAHMSWMNPDITNLVPVLKSPWLTIHVTVIMAGYAFLGLSMLMGLMNQIFYIVANQNNKTRIAEIIDQLSKVNHLSLIIGLYFLTIGMFLGGVWANESWGRYWGWDPKETWALISVLVYAFIAHMHRIPGMRGNYAFNVGSVFGYFAILMTYFGVNYFLGGIHSYAGGAAFTMPWWVYVSVLGLFIIAFVSSGKNKKYFIDQKE